MIKFNCGCGMRLKVAEDQLGKTLLCPSCRQLVMPPGSVESAPQESRPPTPAKAVDKKQSSLKKDAGNEVLAKGIASVLFGSTERIACTAAGGVVILIVLAITFDGNRRWRVDVANKAEAQRASTSAAYWSENTESLRLRLDQIMQSSQTTPIDKAKQLEDVIPSQFVAESPQHVRDQLTLYSQSLQPLIAEQIDQKASAVRGSRRIWITSGTWMLGGWVAIGVIYACFSITNSNARADAESHKRHLETAREQVGTKLALLNNPGK